MSARGHMNSVTLTQWELFMAGIVGVSRNVKGIFRCGTNGRHGEKKNPEIGWQAHCDGASGEVVLAKWTNKYWSGNLGNFKAADVDKFQVRTTPLVDGHLIIYNTDRDMDRFVLCLSHKAPTFFLPGWCFGYEGKLEKYLRNPTPKTQQWTPGELFFIPQKFPPLRPMETLFDENPDSESSTESERTSPQISQSTRVQTTPR